MAETTKTDEVRLEDGAETVFLLPEEITTIEAVHGLRGERDLPTYTKGIEQLASLIEQEGQLQNALVSKVPVNGEVKFHLVAGSRRKDAIAFINAGLGAKATPRKLRCTVIGQVGAIEAVRKAILENTGREDFSPIDLARDIDTVRTLLKVTKDKDWSAKVAQFMGVSRSTITTHFKLLSLPAEVLDQVKAEGWASQTAQDLLDVKPEKLVEVVKTASAKAKTEAAAKPVKAKTGNGNGNKKKETGVQRKHVLAAGREKDAFQKDKPVAKSEIVDVFDSLDGPAYGHENSPVRQFVQYFRDKFVPGIGSETTLVKKFDAMVFDKAGVLYAGEGTPGKEAKEAAKPKAAGAGGKK